MDDNKIKEQIGENLTNLLNRNGKSQRWLSEEIEATETTVSRYIKGERVPSSSTLLKMAKALNSSCDYILGNESKEKKEATMQLEVAKDIIKKHSRNWSIEQKKELIKMLLDIWQRCVWQKIKFNIWIFKKATYLISCFFIF